MWPRVAGADVAFTFDHAIIPPADLRAVRPIPAPLAPAGATVRLTVCSSLRIDIMPGLEEYCASCPVTYAFRKRPQGGLRYRPVGPFSTHNASAPQRGLTAQPARVSVHNPGGMVRYLDVRAARHRRR